MAEITPAYGFCAEAFVFDALLRCCNSLFGWKKLSSSNKLSNNKVSLMPIWY